MSTPSRLIFLTEHSLNRIFTVSTIIQTLLIHVSRKASTLCYKLFHSRLPQNWKSVLLSAWRASNYLHKSTCLSTILNICSTLKTVLSPQTNCGALNKLGKYFLQLPWGSPSCSHSCCASTNTGHSAKPRFFPPELPSRLPPGSSLPHLPNPSADHSWASDRSNRDRGALTLLRGRMSTGLGQVASRVPRSVPRLASPGRPDTGPCTQG